MIEISVVSPVYRAEALVQELVAQLTVELDKITENYEIILVDDRSPDECWSEINKICALNSKIVGIRLSRNFGQHYAISAGLFKAKGKWVVVMDCDLQDQPSQIKKLLDEANNGYDIVLARRAIRQDKWLKRLLSKIFYGILGYLTNTKQDPTIANFGIYNQKVITSINSLSETIRYFPTMVQWVGYQTTKLDVIHAERPDGKSSYSFKKLFNLALDICLANSDKPIRIAIKTGFFIALIGLVFAAYIAIQALRGKIQVLGYASLLVSMWILSGLIIFIIGIVGLYVGKTFELTKNRPAFIIDEVLNHNE